MPKNIGINSWLCSSCFAYLQQKSAMGNLGNSVLLWQPWLVRPRYRSGFGSKKK